MNIMTNILCPLRGLVVSNNNAIFIIYLCFIFYNSEVEIYKSVKLKSTSRHIFLFQRYIFNHLGTEDSKGYAAKKC